MTREEAHRADPTEPSAEGSRAPTEPRGCTCKEIVKGGNICHSNDACECQMFEDFDDPVFCMEDEIKDYVGKI